MAPDRRIARGLFILLVVLAAFLSAAATPPDSAPRRVSMVDIDHQPLKVHDKAEGWAEYPALATTSNHMVLAYSLGKGDRSEVYYQLIGRNSQEVAEPRPIEDGDNNEFRPSVDIMGKELVWCAWSSYSRSGWKIKALVDNITAMGSGVTWLDIYDGDGFNNQVKVACGEKSCWFAWINSHEGAHKVMARRVESRNNLHGVVSVHEGGNPVSRPDILVLEDNHIVVAWDEYIDGSFVVRAREVRSGEPGPIRDLSGTEHSFAWGPSLAGAGDDILVSWQAVPGGHRYGEPRVATLDGGEIRRNIARPGDDETWRVRCFEGPEGRNVLAWTTRKGYRRTTLFMKAIDDDSSGNTVQVEFPMRRTFINWFDCEYDGRLALVYEAGGSIYLYDVEAPRLGALLARMDADDTTREPRGMKPEPHTGPAYATEYDGATLKLYFGDYHNHTSFSDGRAYPDISYLTARDFRKLDFMGVSDHDDTTTPGEFAWNLAVCDCLTRNGEYVCLYGYEENRGWAQNGYGHWNALLWEKDVIFHFKEGMTPDDLYRYARQNNVIFIPHHIGVSWAPHNWGYFDPEAEPVVEVCSIHGIYDNMETCGDSVKCVEGSMIIDGLEKGYRFGFVGGSDYHNCFAAALNEHSLTGVYAEELTREHVLDAIRRKRTFATTGDKIVVDFRCNGKFMGEEVHGKDPLHFTAYMKSESPIVSAELVSGGTTVLSENLASSEASYTWQVENPGEETYFYLRLTTQNGEYAWSSPIYLVP